MAAARRSTRKGFRLMSLSLAGAAIAGFSVVIASPAPDKSKPEGSRGLGVERRWELRQEQILREHTDSTGTVRPDLWRQGIEEYLRMRDVARSAEAPSGGVAGAGGIVGMQWRQIGPAPLRID